MLAAVLVAPLLALSPAPAGAAADDITTFGPTGVDHPTGIVAGPEGNLWFGNFGTDGSPAHSIGRISPAGSITSFDGEAAGLGRSNGMAAGPDGNVWFTSFSNDKVGRITPTGGITTFTDAEDEVKAPHSIAADGAGRLWFTSMNNDRIGVITPATGAIDTYTAAGLDGPQGITLGPDGNMWFASFDSDAIGRITSAGAITMFPGQSAGVDGPQGITKGPDGNLWFTSQQNSRIGRITPGGAITTYTDRANRVLGPSLITAGPDGNLWFTSFGNDRVGRVDPDNGAIATIPGEFTGVDGPTGIAAGPDGNIWVTSHNNNRIARVDLCDGASFSDVPTSHPFFTDICWMDENGVARGFRDGTYGPDRPVKRQAMSAFMYRLAGSPAFDEPGSPSFVDVPVSHTFFREIEWMAAEGITTGYPGRRYKPDLDVSRAAMSAFMYRLADEPTFSEPGSPSFTDVPVSHAFFREIEWMAAEGITTGFAGGTYRPTQPVKRQSMAAFMHRLASITGMNP